MEEFIPYATQEITEQDIEEVVRALKSGWLTTGPKVKEFEEALCSYIGCKHSITVNSGTSALNIAVKALELPEGSEIITTPFTFVADSNVMLYNNLVPVFADIDMETKNISPDEIKKKITDKTKAIIYVDYAGHPCEIDEIKKIAEENGLFLIEDACHALGSEYKGKKIGNFANMTILSFHPVKHITTGEGGAVLTNNDELASKLRSLRNHGIDKTPADRDNWIYDMKYLGENYRITDLQCALGFSQIKRIEEFIKRRQGIVDIYNKEFENIDWIETPKTKSYVRNAWHLYTIILKGVDRKDFFDYMKKNNIGVNVHYIPSYRFSYYKKNFNFKPRDFPVTESVYERIITLPLYPKMTDEQVQKVIRVVKNYKPQKLQTTKLCMGTVQLGMDYGVNEKKQTPRKEALEMLKYAYDEGIRVFDVAFAYGEAEEVLGEFIKNNNLKDKIKVISKLKPNIFDEDKRDPEIVIEEEIKKSCSKLNVDRLYGYLFHTPDYITNKKIVDGLKRAKEKGFVENVGVSVYEIEHAIIGAQMPVDFIQIPYNIIDQRLHKTDFFNLAKKNNIKVFARSPFLQGLLLIEKDVLPEKVSWKKGYIKELPEVKEYIQEIEKITSKYELSKVEACLCFSYLNRDVDYVVFGVHDINQLKQNIQISREKINLLKVKDCVQELRGKFGDVKKAIILPSLWKKKD